MAKKRTNRKMQDDSPKMSAKDAMDFADACDLPDGAYWAMVEELSGCEPADCIEEE